MVVRPQRSVLTADYADNADKEKLTGNNATESMNHAKAQKRQRKATELGVSVL
jgi:hypothetical protein